MLHRDTSGNSMKIAIRSWLYGGLFLLWFGAGVWLNNAGWPGWGVMIFEMIVTGIGLYSILNKEFGRLGRIYATLFLLFLFFGPYISYHLWPRACGYSPGCGYWGSHLSPKISTPVSSLIKLSA